MQEIRIMYCNSCALQQGGRNSVMASWQRWAGTDYFCALEDGWFTCQYFKVEVIHILVHLRAVLPHRCQFSEWLCLSLISHGFSPWVFVTSSNTGFCRIFATLT